MKTEKYEFIFRRLATILATAIVTLSLTAAITGILLAYYYEPSAGGAYDSLQTIDTEVSNGWLIHTVHNLAGNGLIGVSLIEIVVMFLGRKYQPSWLTAWISGILLTLSAIALGWTAMILDWSQLGYWRLSIELQTIEAIPFIGPQLRAILTGGGAIGTETVEHFYTIHSYVLSIGALAIAIIHLAAIILQEIEQKRLQRKLEANSLVTESENGETPLEPTPLSLTGGTSKK